MERSIGGSEGLPFLLIEEPEAHLHPQMQSRLTEILETRSAEGADARVQILLTTHSPILASKVDISVVTVLSGGRAFSLNQEATNLEPSDYSFLRRFLDATKANLFFARAVVIVEGDAENILLPVIAEKLGRPFGKHGVSVVSVGHRGLFRYSRIFQRRDGSEMPVRVACIADRDIPPAAAKTFVDPPRPPADPNAPAPKKFEDDFTAPEIVAREARLRRRDGGSVRTFVSPSWTYEHDLALWGQADLMHRAIGLAVRSKSKGDVLTDAEVAAVKAAKDQEIREWRDEAVPAAEIAARVYRPLHESKASKAETAQYAAEELKHTAIDPVAMRAALPAYLIEAIDFMTQTEPAQANAAH